MVRAAAADCAGSEASSLTLRTILAPRTPPALLIWSTASCMPFLLWTPTRIPAPVTERSAPSLIVLPVYELVAQPPPPLVSQATTMTAATNAETRLNRFTSTVFHVRQTSRLEPFQQSGNVQPGVRVLRVHLLQRLDEDSRHRPVPVVLVVCRDHVPRRPSDRAACDGNAVCALVVVPVSTFVDVVNAELPLLVGILESVDQTFPLLLIGDMKANLDELDALVRDLPLEAVDELVTTLDDIERGEIVDPHDQHVLVMRAVEDADVSREGQAAPDAPEEAVPLLRGGRLLEGRDLDRLRVQVADDVRDGAVLTARVHALKHQQQRLFALCVQLVLELEQGRMLLGEVFQRPLLVGGEARGRCRVDVGEPKASVFDLGAKQVADLLRNGRKSIGSLRELHRNDFEGHQLAAAQDGQPELRPDLRLDHQALQVARLAHGHVAHRDDDVSAAKRGRSRGTARDHLLHLDSSLAAEALRHGGRQRSSAAGDAEEGSANTTASHQRRKNGLGGLVDRHGQSESHPRDGGVDTNEARLPVGQRAARVAGVERGIGLDDVFDEAAVPVAVSGRQRAA